MCFDDWGRKYVSSNSNHIQQVIYEDRYLAGNPFVTAPSARRSMAADGPQAPVFESVRLSRGVLFARDFGSAVSFLAPLKEEVGQRGTLQVPRVSPSIAVITGAANTLERPSLAM